MRAGQEAKSSAHFITFDNKKAYKFYCSCDAFILALSSKFDYAEEMKDALERRDIDKIAEITRKCEDYVRSVDYFKFLEELEEHVEASIIEADDYVEDLDEVFEEVEIVFY